MEVDEIETMGLGDAHEPWDPVDFNDPSVIAELALLDQLWSKSEAKPKDVQGALPEASGSTPVRLKRGERNDRAFDDKRKALTTKAAAVVKGLIAEILAYEQQNGTRQRRRKVEDLKLFKKAVEAVACDVAHRGLSQAGRNARVRLSLCESGPARNKQGQALFDAVYRLADLGYLKFDKGFRLPNDWRLSTMWATDKLMGLGLALTDLTSTAKFPLVRLRDEAKDSQRFPMTPQIAQWEANQQRINDALTANLTMEPGAAGIEDHVGNCLDASRIRLYRVFHDSSWDKGGRQYGGWWMTINKATRLEAMRIAGKRLAEVDYCQLFPTMLYGLAGLKLEGDAYTIPGLEDSRSGVKVMLNSMLNAARPLKQWPDGRLAGKFKGSGLSCMGVANRILEHHQAIADRFYTGYGVHLMRYESDIVIEAQLRLLHQGIVSAPCHDSLLVSMEYVEETQRVMLEVFEERMGFPARVDVSYP
ncbi:hypothetical protein [Cupriavidus sp. D39]|uniref:hypothetical protein n=1 Tax=Cupriavidus sp. D39 TaxID=2997877 RepID=UPI00226F7EDA|nr:hypothetical protein [Cupriavidus sp. D39]MCY0856026.1 hypothetical protein [Cupriavidus sp. D39]